MILAKKQMESQNVKAKIVITKSGMLCVCLNGRTQRQASKKPIRATEGAGEDTTSYQSSSQRITR